MLMNDMLFTPLTLRRITLPNRLVRSATYEGLGLPDGEPLAELGDLYARLAGAGAGAIITGFCFVAQDGRAMQPRQCGIHSDRMIAPWRAIVQRVRREAPDTRLFMQLAHTGRQTRRSATGRPVVGASRRRCTYFREPVRPLTAATITRIVADFGAAARRAQQAGFDGIQVHAAHGYLVHQFLSPHTNTRTDEWADGARFLTAVVDSIRSACGDAFPILAKFSAADDRGMTIADTVRHLRAVAAGLDAAEISYGTMEYGLNIIRGGCPVERAFAVNPLFSRVPRRLRGLFLRFVLATIMKRQIPFSENYNLAAAAQIAGQVNLPVFAVGGFRRAAALRAAMSQHGMAAVSLCRPFVCEPALARALRANDDWESACTNCNLCTINCDAPQPLACVQTKRGERS